MRYRLFALLLLLPACQSLVLDPVILRERAYFAAVAAHDAPLPPPQPGDWLAEHPEPGQSFSQYRRRVQEPETTRRVIYLQPIGPFAPEQRRVLRATQQYLSAFFQRPVVLRPDTVLAQLPDSAHRRAGGHEQLLAPYLLYQVLQHQLPPDGLALMAISAQDIYPQSSWSYVFGLASYPRRVGVTSIYRLQELPLTAAGYPRCLARLGGVAAHEIGHMLGLQHCTYARCAMNGANSLAETDASPNRLCSECQMKLFWRLRYDNRQRLQDLATFFRANGLQPDFALARWDLQALE